MISLVVVGANTVCLLVISILDRIHHLPFNKRMTALTSHLTSVAISFIKNKGGGLHELKKSLSSSKIIIQWSSAIWDIVVLVQVPILTAKGAQNPKILMPKAPVICLDLTYFVEGQGLSHTISIFRSQTPRCIMVLHFYGLPKWNILVPILWTHPSPAPRGPISMHVWINTKSSFYLFYLPRPLQLFVNIRLCRLQRS